MNNESGEENQNRPAPTGAGPGSESPGGLGGNANQQAAKPNGSDGGNSSGSENNGSLPAASLPSSTGDANLLLARPVSVKFDYENDSWLQDQTDSIGITKSDLIRHAVTAARLKTTVRPIILRPRWEEASVSLRQYRELFHEYRTAMRALKGQSASWDDATLRQNIAALYSYADRLEQCLKRVLNLIGGFDPESLLQVIKFQKYAELKSTNPEIKENAREMFARISDALICLGIKDLNPNDLRDQ